MDVSGQKHKCHWQRVELLSSTRTLISGLEINIYTSIHTHIYVYICFIVLLCVQTFNIIDVYFCYKQYLNQCPSFLYFFETLQKYQAFMKTEKWNITM